MFGCFFFAIMFCRFLSHYTDTHNPSTESSVGEFTPCFFELWLLGA